MIIHDFKQRTDEWYKVRAGKFTGSDFHICFGDSQAKKTLLLKKASEIIIGKVIENNYTNSDMQRGIENENVAVAGYELTTNSSITTVGFCELNERVGCSPDGLIGDDGIIEIKCPNHTIFLQQVIANKIKPEYFTQIQFNLYVTGRKWCDYVAYNEDFDLFIKRIERDEEYIKKIVDCLDDCIKEVAMLVDKFKGLKSVA